MKNILIAILLIIGVSGCRDLHEGDIVRSVSREGSQCSYSISYSGTYEQYANFVIAPCGKFKVGDTIWITNKRP